MQHLTDLQMDQLRRGVPAVVSLLGGIGDHLEVISMLLEWCRMDNQELILVVTPQRKKVLRPLLETISELKLQSNVHPRAIQNMAMREWICRQFGAIRYKEWIINKIDKHTSTQDHLFCWKARGEGNRLSAYLRSVPFRLVLNYYKTKRQIQPGTALVDISDWNSEETLTLQELGVQCHNPRDLGLNGLIRICRNKQVISIDTALAHLCAVMGKNATLLLNHIPDERWVELLRSGNCYSKYLKITQQKQFYDWEESLTSLLTCSSA